MAATQMVLLLVLLPFAAYIVGDRIGASGILAAVAAGVMTNFTDLSRSEFVAERMQTEGAWTLVESAFNGAVFLLLGLQLPSIIGVTLREAGDRWWLPAGYAAAISSALLLLRWVWLTIGVQGSLWRAHGEGKMIEKPSYLLTVATTLAGIRGAVTLAGALSVPLLLNNADSFPGRDLLIFLATSTILLTLMIGTIGLPLVLKHIPSSGEPASAQEERRARVAACKAAITNMVLGKEQAESVDPQWLSQYQESAGRLTQEYRRRIDLLEDPVPAATPEASTETQDAIRQRRHRYVVELELRLKSLHVERDTLYEERHEYHINDESLRSLVAELDLAEASLRKRLHVARQAAGLVANTSAPFDPLDPGV